MLQRAQVFAVRLTYYKSLLIILKHFLSFLQRGSFTESRAKFERSDRFQQGNILEIIEHMSYSSCYCKISLLIYSESNSLSNAGPF